MGLVINKDAYTLRAEAGFKKVENDEAWQTAVASGNKNAYDEVMMEEAVYRLKFGDYLKRYIYDRISDGTLKIEELSREELKAHIQEAFRDNGMSNRGSMNPATATKLNSQLDKWLDTPAFKLDRQTIFLFAFGLHMDDEETESMLHMMRGIGFNPRSYREAIYYYCLRNNKKYADVKEWLEFYDQLPEVEPDEKAEAMYATRVLNRDMMRLSAKMDEQRFKEYLAELKRMPFNNKAGKGEREKVKKSLTRAEFLREKLGVLNQMMIEEYALVLDRRQQKYNELDEKPVFTATQRVAKEKNLQEIQRSLMKAAGRVNPSRLQRKLESLADEDAKAPKVLTDLIEAGIVEIPAFTGKAIEKRITERTSEVSREDILMVSFLISVCRVKDELRKKDQHLYRNRKAIFYSEANRNLEKCGYGEIYLVNPYDAFLLSCLLQDQPLSYYLGIWKKHRNEKD